MPGATGVLRRNDRVLAAQLYDRGIPLLAVDNAILLAATRRIYRPPDAPALQRSARFTTSCLSLMKSLPLPSAKTITATSASNSIRH
jgi:hypothetical protein